MLYWGETEIKLVVHNIVAKNLFFLQQTNDLTIFLSNEVKWTWNMCIEAILRICNAMCILGGRTRFQGDS